MNNQKSILNLNCIRSIIRIETPQTRLDIFSAKVEKSQRFIRIPLKFIYKKRLIPILSVLVSAKESLKIYKGINNIVMAHDIISFYCTKNQKTAITSLFDTLNITQISNKNHSIKSALHASIVLLMVSFTKRKQLKFIGKTNLSFLLETLRYIFYYEYFQRLITKYPQISIISNDHSPQPLAFYSLCKQNCCKTVYLQHGHVSKHFPPLYRFDLAVLFGEKSKEIYLDIGKGSKQIVLSGHSYSTAKQLKPCPHLINITIFPNLIYENHLLSLIYELRENKNIKNIHVKPHPLHLPSKSLAMQINSVKNTEILSADSNYQKFTDLGIAANTSMHIELLSQGINSVYFDELDEFEFDYYGFVENKSVLNVKRAKDITAEYINQFYQTKEWKNNISLFDSAFNTEEFMNKEIQKLSQFFEI